MVTDPDARPSWRVFVLRGVWVGIFGWVGLTHRLAEIQKPEMSWEDAARDTWPSAVALVVIILLLVWAIPAFNRRFPRRPD